MCTFSVVDTPLTPVASALLQGAANTSVSVALPSNSSNTPPSTKIMLTNIGSTILFINLGTSGVEATIWEGVPVLPNQNLFLSIGTNDHIAAISESSTELMINTGY
jgi:hypothetical protein